MAEVPDGLWEVRGGFVLLLSQSKSPRPCLFPEQHALVQLAAARLLARAALSGLRSGAAQVSVTQQYGRKHDASEGKGALFHSDRICS